MSKSFKRVLLVLLIPIVLVVVIAVIVQEVQESDLKRAEARNDVAASMSDLRIGRVLLRKSTTRISPDSVRFLIQSCVLVLLTATGARASRSA